MYEYSTTISSDSTDRNGLQKIGSSLWTSQPFPHTLYQEDETEVPRIEGQRFSQQRVVAQLTFEINSKQSKCDDAYQKELCCVAAFVMYLLPYEECVTILHLSPHYTFTLSLYNSMRGGPSTFYKYLSWSCILMTVRCIMRNQH